MEPSTSLCFGETRTSILQKYHEILGATYYDERNPVSQPISLERAHFSEFLERDYMISDKSDGTRYVLFLTRAEGREIAVMVDRKLALYQIPVAASRSHFQGSVYDGELVFSNGCHLFLVFDCVASKGTYVGDRDFLARLSLIRGAFDLEGASIRSPEEASVQARKGKIVCGGSARGLAFKPKPCFQLRQMDTLLRQMSSLPYKTDGLVFTPVDEPVRLGTHSSMFKYKRTHSIDVEVALDGSELLLGLGGSPTTAVLRTPLSGLGVPFRLDEGVTERLEEYAGCILEMKICPGDGCLGLVLVCRRSDKTHPNAVATVLRTVNNVKEDIMIEELLEVAQKAADAQDLRKGCVA
jgi:mRNA capping enzyme, catalytic domain